MYAVIQTGGKQYRVQEGDRLEIDRIADDALSISPLLIVDGDKVVSGSAAAKGTVKLKKVSDIRGKKINAFTYKNKSRVRKRWGHRSELSLVEVGKITKTSGTTKAKADAVQAESGE